jgi:tetratricopeptide (TPR) repeat protein
MNFLYLPEANLYSLETNLYSQKFPMKAVDKGHSAYLTRRCNTFVYNLIFAFQRINIVKSGRFLFAFVFFPLTILTAQHARIDSLKIALHRAQADTDRINTLVRLGNAIENINPDSAVLLGNQALALSRRILWGKGIVSSQYYLGIYYEIKGGGAIAFAYEDSALVNSSKYKYSGKLSSIYNELGNIVSDQNNYSTGLDYYFKALIIDSINGESPAYIYNNIGLNYKEMGQYVKAEQYYLKAEKLDEEINNKEHLASLYGNLGNLYYLQGNYKKGIKNNLKALELDSSINAQGRLISDYQNTGLGYLYLNIPAIAMAYGFKSISLSEKLGVLANLQKSLNNIGQEFQDIYKVDSTGKGFSYTRNGIALHVIHTALLDSAFTYYQNSIKYADSSMDKICLLTATRGVGDIYALRNDYPRAILNYQLAYRIADSLGVLYEKMVLSQVLGHALAKTSNYPMAIKYLDNMVVLKDSLFGKEKNKQMAEMEAKYQNEKKEKEIETLAQKNELQIKQSRYAIFGLASLALLIAAIAFLLIRQNRINTLNAKIEMEQKLLRSQMNPHFIFNAMTSIQSYIYSEDPKTAANYLSSVFRLMRSIMESSKKEYVLLEKEMSALKDYLILQQLCAQDKFDFTIDIDDKIDIESTLIPPMLAQPFIENSIKHGILNNPIEKGKLQIRLYTANGMILMEIEDNGIGRERSKEISNKQKGDHLSVATDITRERIALLNRNSSRKMEIKILDLKNEKNEGIGTKVVLHIPLITLDTL